MSRPLQIASHLCVVLVACLLGIAVRGSLRPAVQAPPAKAAEVHPRGKSSDFRPEETVAGAPLSEASEAEFAQLLIECRGAFDSPIPLRAQALTLKKLLERLHTSADYARAVHLLDSLPGWDESNGHYVLPISSIFFTRWAALDPLAALAGTAQLNHLTLSSNGVQTVVKLWGEKDSSAARDYLTSLPPGHVKALGNSVLFAALAEIDPQASLELAGSLGDPTQNQQVAATLRRWAEQDPAAALKYSLTKASSADRYEMLSALGAAMPLQAFEEAAAAAVLSREQREQLMKNALTRHYITDVEAGLKAAQELKEPAVRRAVVKELVSQQALNDSEKAARLLASLPPADREPALEGLAWALVEAGDRPQPAQAAQWIEQLPDGEAKTSLLKRLGARWGHVDGASASQWLTEQTPGPQRDVVIGEFVRTVFRTDPEAALAWSAGLSDQAKRQRRLDELFPQWLQKDPARAQQWLAETPHLRAAEREALVEKLGKR